MEPANHILELGTLCCCRDLQRLHNMAGRGRAGQGAVKHFEGGAGNGRACTGGGRSRRVDHGETIGDEGPAVSLVGAQLGVAHNVDYICCHQLIVLVSVPLPACTSPLSKGSPMECYVCSFLIRQADTQSNRCREVGKQIGRQADIQPNMHSRPTGRQAGRQTDAGRQGQMDTKTCRQTDRQPAKDRQSERETFEHTDNQRARQTERQACMHAQADRYTTQRRARQDQPEGSGGVDDVQGAMAKAGLSVCTPCRLLLVAVASWITTTCTVAISLHNHGPGHCYLGSRV